AHKVTKAIIHSYHPLSMPPNRVYHQPFALPQPSRKLESSREVVSQIGSGRLDYLDSITFTRLLYPISLASKKVIMRRRLLPTVSICWVCSRWRVAKKTLPPPWYSSIHSSAKAPDWISANP